MLRRSIKCCCFSIFFAFSFISLGAQNSSESTISSLSDLIIQRNRIDSSEVALVYNKNRDFYLKGEPLSRKLNPLNWIFGGMLYFYQEVLSNQFSADCLFYPTCSEFCKHAMRRHGLIRGLLLTSDRVARCNQISQSDLHPMKFDEKKRRFFDGVELYDGHNGCKLKE